VQVLAYNRKHEIMRMRVQ